MDSKPSNEAFPQRRKPASGVFSAPHDPVIVYLTVCTKQRARCLANEKVHDVVRNAWIEANGWLVGMYVVMPDHLHLFCAPGLMDVPLEVWVAYWKRLVTQELEQREWRWQSRGWDTRLRTKENYAEKWEYVWQNPVRAGLVSRPEDWPFRGELNTLQW